MPHEKPWREYARPIPFDEHHRRIITDRVYSENKARRQWEKKYGKALQLYRADHLDHSDSLIKAGIGAKEHCVETFDFGCSKKIPFCDFRWKSDVNGLLGLQCTATAGFHVTRHKHDWYHIVQHYYICGLTAESVEGFSM
ncbi:hypothetical protein TNCT_576631 [Trichonephila clavata]|uniref:Uncharacterized protein n=1 Tax=Trichonephila clavata TaxID=2740835 RepID=A0A8X6JFT0_TRICU|nr:hypothetical protein TNCT_576631 [Trichonephila clavata]